MTMYRVVDYSAANMTRYRNLRCSRSQYLRCAPRFLVSGHFLGPESPTFSTFI